MMKKLNISELRPGPSGNPEAPNAANSDEALVPPYDNLPDPLIFNDGTSVNSADEWPKRHLEIQEIFDREIYGRVPNNTPAVSWIVISRKDTIIGDIPATETRVKGEVDNSAYPTLSVAIDLTLTTPENTNSVVPVMLHFGFDFRRLGRRPPTNSTEPSWQQQLLQKGWAYAVLVPTSFQADNGAGLQQGIIGLMNKGKPRDRDDWGTLRAWAWGASRAIDYIESVPGIDEQRIGIEGLSRYGKAAIVALAYEPRIAIGFIGSSGAGGTKLMRRIFGEQVENLASSAEYHWFAGNFIKYAGPLNQNDLPVDAHELIALCAPRPIFISVGDSKVEGTWVDAKGMFLSGVHAGPVYRLLGEKGLGQSEFPPLETSLIDGEIAFRQHNGGHTTGPNWPYFIEFAERYFTK